MESDVTQVWDISLPKGDTRPFTLYPSGEGQCWSEANCEKGKGQGTCETS